MKDLDGGVYAEIRAERQRQNAKWGVQRHSAVLWATILSEESGEVECVGGCYNP